MELDGSNLLFLKIQQPNLNFLLLFCIKLLTETQGKFRYESKSTKREAQRYILLTKAEYLVIFYDLFPSYKNFEIK